MNEILYKAVIKSIEDAYNQLYNVHYKNYNNRTYKDSKVILNFIDIVLDKLLLEEKLNKTNIKTIINNNINILNSDSIKNIEMTKNFKIKQFEKIIIDSIPKNIKMFQKYESGNIKYTTGENMQYILKTKSGDQKVSFTKKRGQILELLQDGKTVNEIVKMGYSETTTNIVRRQAVRLRLIQKE